MKALRGIVIKREKPHSFREGFFILLLSLLCGSCHFEATGIPVIGLDANGEHGQVFIPNREYPNRLYAATESIQESTVTTLNQTSVDNRSSWLLRTVAVGIGVSTTIGIGPLFIGAFPRFRVIFTNSLVPLLP